MERETRSFTGRLKRGIIANKRKLAQQERKSDPN